ncbi:MAG: hypothetical protein WB760_11660 [Xanthobacteraceae bacterium]
MPSSRNKTPDDKKYLKRRTFEQGKKEIDAAHIVTQQLYCDALEFWRQCKLRVCQRHRRCRGQPTNCLACRLKAVPRAERLKAEQEVIAGGSQRLPPATHIEWTIRRTELSTLVEWGFG